ncbi:MAG: hypothetical protein P8Y68_06830 [Anaerolineales bacterium]
MQDRKKVGLIVTLVTVFLCGFPGLCAFAFGVFFSFDLESFGWDVTGNPRAVAIPAICIGAILILIPLAAGIYTFVQSRKTAEVSDIEVPPAL